MLVFLLACSGTSPPDSDTDPATVPVPPSPAATADTGDTDDTDVAPPAPLYRPEQLVCTDLPPLPTTFTNLPFFGPHEDFSFDALGNLVGVDAGANLSGRNRNGQTTLFSPNIGEAKGTRFLPDGTVVIALSAEGAIGHVLADGQQVILASVPAPNGLAVDLFGNTWVASSSGSIFRVAPDGTQLIAGSYPGSLDGIAFSPDYRRLYFNSEFGVVRVFDLDDDGDPIGPAQVFANVPLTLSLLDGMTTDVCGNLYVVRMDGRVFRYLPDGTPSGFVNFAAAPGFQVTPAVNFGSGVGGFHRDHLYAMNFLGGVIEVDLGIDGRWEPHYPIPQ